MNQPLPDFLWVDDIEELGPPPPPERRATPGVPGEVGIWIFVLGDMTIFGALFSVFLWENRGDRELFAASTQELYQPIGAVNTLVLLLSSYLVVLAVNAHRRDRFVPARRLLTGALACAATFAGLKAVEYSLEIGDGHTPASNAFFTFYFVLTGIHLLHVMIGAALLAVWMRKAARSTPWADSSGAGSRGFVEGSAVYWHMVDLLWIIIFTLLYLVCVA